MDDARVWEEYAAQSEKRRYADAQHKRETRAFALVGVSVVVAVLVVLLSMMRGCAAGADRAHELEMNCLSRGGSWTGSMGVGGDPASCTQGVRPAPKPS